MALQFAGTGSAQYIRRTTNFQDTDPYTWLFAVRIDTAADNSGLWDLRYYSPSPPTPPNTGHALKSGTGGSNLAFTGSANYGASTSAVRTLTASTWYWVVIRASSTSLKMVILDHGATSITGEVTLTQTALTPNRVFYGAGDGTNESSKSTIAFIREWSASLSDAEVLAEIGSATPVRTTNLVEANTCRGADLTTALSSETGSGFTAPNGGVSYIADEPSFTTTQQIVVGGLVSIEPQVSITTVSQAGSAVTVAGVFASVFNDAIITVELLSGTTVSYSAVATQTDDTYTATISGISDGAYTTRVTIADSQGTTSDTGDSVFVPEATGLRCRATIKHDPVSSPISGATNLRMIIWSTGDADAGELLGTKIGEYTGLTASAAAYDATLGAVVSTVDADFTGAELVPLSAGMGVRVLVTDGTRWTRLMDDAVVEVTA